MHRVGTVANIVRYVTAPDGSHHLVCQGEQRFQVVEFLEGWPFLVARVLRLPEADVAHARDRGALPQPQGAGRRGDRAPAAGAARAGGRRAIDPIAGRSSPISRPPTWTSRRARSRRSSRRSMSTARMDKVLDAARAPDRGAASVAGDRPADQGRARRAPARGAAARADGDDPAPARRRRRRQGRTRSPSSTRRSPRPACRRRSRTRRARNCAGCSACRKPRPNTAWCAPISTG